MPRVMLTMSEEERDALVALARAERRDPRAQAAIELRRALERAGYLPATKAGGQPALPQATEVKE